MLVYEKVVDGVRHLFGTMGNIPSNDDEQLTYKDSDGDVIEPTLNASYFDDKKGGIVDAEGKEINVFIGDNCIIGDVETPEVVTLTIKTAPTKTTYIEGQELSLAGLVLEATMKDGDVKEITEGFTSEPANGDVLATSNNKVTITFGGKTVEQAITVNAKTLTGIAFTKAPTKTEYFVGDALDMTGAEVTATYDNGTTAIVAPEFTPADGTVLTVNDTTVTATYNGKTATQEITVTAVSLVSIELTKENKTYTVGDTLDLSDAVVTATYNNGTTSDVTAQATFVPANGATLTAEDTTLTATFEGKTSSVELTINAVVEQQNAEPEDQGVTDGASHVEEELTD